MVGEQTLAEPKLKVTLWCIPTPPNKCLNQVSTFYTLRNPRNSLDNILKLMLITARSNQGHTMMFHTYNPQSMSLPSIILLYFTVSEI